MRTRVIVTVALTVLGLSVANLWGAGFADDFDRPDGAVGNGWAIQKYGTIEVQLVDHEVLIAGRQPSDWWWRSGISRSVEDATKFSFDFKADDNFNVHISLRDLETTDGAMEFYAWPHGPFSYASRVSDTWTGWTKIPGSQMLAGQYNNLVVEQDGTDFTLTLNGQVVGTATNNIPFHIKEVFIGSDATPGHAGSLHIDNVVIGKDYRCIVDFNGDGKVDGADVLTMADHWSTDYPSCDIAPMSGGDGIVDVQDLRRLAEYIGKPVDDPTLVAHWALDETEGIVAADSAGDSDAAVMGVPAWRPDGGQVGGALEFDGVSVFVVTDVIVRSADSPFSILAWIKGGEAGQAVISEQAGGDWLYANPADGTLVTECPGRFPRSLFSDKVITDDQWHRIGVIWDGSQRRLYVDGEEVAADTQDGLATANGRLVLGAGSHLGDGTFFTGLIDDVRIYNRAVRP